MVPPPLLLKLVPHVKGAVPAPSPLVSLHVAVRGNVSVESCKARGHICVQ
jgi:hypothetical protein